MHAAKSKPGAAPPPPRLYVISRPYAPSVGSPDTSVSTRVVCMRDIAEEQKMKIQGAVALVTGGASGLGEATVRRLVTAGARVVIVDRDNKRGPALESELGERARFV